MMVLCELIRNQQRKQESLDESKVKASKYGYDLFRYFCDHQDRSKIIIKDFKSIPFSFLNSDKR